MASKDREREFPATSIGRTSGTRLQQTISVQESHPLGLNALSPESSAFTQKYRTYTPRTRGTPSPAVGSSQTAVLPTITPGTLIHPPSPHRHQPAGGGDATTKLRLTNAKAEAKDIGLDTGGSEGPSIGWAMLEKIVSESETGEVWTEVWNAMTTGKATVLLPLELLSSADKLTPEFFKDHIVFYDSNLSSSAKATPIVTFSGLRGTIHRNTITFVSTLHPASPLFRAIEDPSNRSSALHKLPPLPTSKSLHTDFPPFCITTSKTTLPLPPKPQAPKPPLPPRPSTRPISTIGGTSTSSHASGSVSSQSRIPNPFASLFGHRPSTPTPPPPPPPPTSQHALAVTSSPTASIQSLESLSTQAPAAAAGVDSHAVEVDVMVIQKKIVRRDVGKAMNKSVRREVKASLNPPALNTNDGVAEVPEWVLDRVLEFCEPWFPFIRAPKMISLSKAGAIGGGDERGKEKEEWLINPMEIERFEDTVDFTQDFYAQLADFLRVELLGHNGHSGSPAREHKEKKATTTTPSEIKIRVIIELVEKTICSLFYDRLFSQPQTDDSSHDSALSNRIAALNLLDLTLEHLDIAVEEESKAEVEDVVNSCGAKLCRLDSARTPKEKARMLVDAHQVVVEGLSRLPPVRLMSAAESKALREQQAASLLKDEDKKGAAAGPDGPVSTTTGTTLTITDTSATIHEPALITSEGPPHHGLSTSAQETAPGPDPQLSPLSLTTSELPSTSASETASPALNSHSSPPPPPPPDAPTSDSSPKKPHDKPTPVSSDVLLPMLIFSTVKSNPPHLISNLLYLQRFRHRNAYSYSSDGVNGDGNGGGGGEESFCLINLLAVAEFLENVDLAGLGLGTVSVADVSASELSPIIARNSPQTPTTPTTATATLTPNLTPSGVDGAQLPGGPGSFFFRGKVEQQVDAIAGSANKVISGVVDSSFGILRSFLPQNQTDNVTSAMSSSVTAGVGGIVDGSGGAGVGAPVMAKSGQGGFGLLRKDTGFLIANIAVSIPSISRSNSKSQQDEEGQQLMAVSKPGSIRSTRSGKVVDEESEDEESEDEEENEENEKESEDEDEDTSGTGETESEEEDGGSDEEDRQAEGIAIPGIQLNSPHQHPYSDPSSSVVKHASASVGSFGTDTRSIRSFESMLSDSKKRQREKKLKKLAKDNEKERRKEEKRMRARDKKKARERVEGGKNASVSADKASSAPRKSLTDRLASVGAQAGGIRGPPPDILVAPISIVRENRGSLVHTRHGGSPSSSRAASPSLPLSRSPSPLQSRTTSGILPPLPNSQAFPNANPISVVRSMSGSTTVASGVSPGGGNNLALPPPKKRFMECSVDELTIREVGELLSEYRRLVEGVRGLGGFAAE